MEKEFTKEAAIFKAFCDPNRLKVLETLKKGEHCACTLLENLDVSQATLSHHMKILADADVVNVRKQGKWVYYSLSEEGIDKVSTYIGDLKCGNDKSAQNTVCCLKDEYYK